MDYNDQRTKFYEPAFDADVCILAEFNMDELFTFHSNNSTELTFV